MNGTPLEFSWPERSEIEEALILERALGIGPFEVLVCQDLNAEPGRRNDDTDPPTLVLHDGRWESPGGYALGAPFETIPDPGDLPRERMERVMAALGVDGEEYADFLERSGIDGSAPFSQTEMFEEFVDCLLVDLRGVPALKTPGASCDEYLDALKGVYEALGLPAGRFSVTDRWQRHKTECLVVLTAGWAARTFEDRKLPSGQLETEIRMLRERMTQQVNGEIYRVEIRDADTGDSLDVVGGLWGVGDVEEHLRENLPELAETLVQRRAPEGLSDPGL